MDTTIKPKFSFPLFSALRMASPDTIILLIADCRAAIGGGGGGVVQNPVRALLAYAVSYERFTPMAALPLQGRACRSTATTGCREFG